MNRLASRSCHRVQGAALAALLPLFAAPAPAAPVVLTGDYGRVQVVKEDLSDVGLAIHTVLGGGQIAALSGSPGGTLVLGASGDVQLVGKDGRPASAPTPALPVSLGARAAWSGSEWLVGGLEGHVRRIGADGQPIGSETLVFPAPIHVLVWAGDGWLAFGSEHIRHIDPNGVPSGPLPLLPWIPYKAAWSGSVVMLANGGNVMPVSSYGVPLGPAVKVLPPPQSVADIVWIGDALMVVGVDGGSQLVDETGKALTSPVSSGAKWSAVAWSGSSTLAVGLAGATRAFGADGAPLGPVNTALGGSAITAVTWLGDGWLVSGPAGQVQRLDVSGAPTSKVHVVADWSSATAASWSGAHWLVAGSTGSALVDPAAPLIAPALGLTGDVRPLGWSGEHWLVGTSAGVARLDAAGAPVEAFTKLPGGGTADSGDWNGERWLLRMSSGTCHLTDAQGRVEATLEFPCSGSGYGVVSGGGSWLLASTGSVRLVGPDGTPASPWHSVIDLGSDAIAWNGQRFLIGSITGRVRLLDAAGQIAGPVVSVMPGVSIVTITWTGHEWIVGGANGKVRRLAPDGAPAAGMETAIDGKYMRAASYGGPVRGAGEQCLRHSECLTGACIAGSCRADCLIDGEQLVAGETDPGNGCRRCDPAVSTTTWTISPVGAACDDGDPCTAGDVCGAGACIPGGALSCDDRSPCTVDRCAGGSCEHVDAGGPGCAGAVLAAGEGGIGIILEHGKPVPAFPTQAVLGGQDALAAAWNGADVLVGGAAGAVRRVGPDGLPAGAAATALGGKAVRAAAWGGSAWLVAGDGGLTQRVDASGQVVGSPVVALAANIIYGAAFDGEAWVVAGERGRVQRIGATGAVLGPFVSVLDAKLIRALACGPPGCLVGGDGGRVQLLAPDGTPGPVSIAIGGNAVRAVGWDGARFLVAGGMGQSQAVGADGVPIAASLRQHAGEITGVAASPTGWIAVEGAGRSPVLTPDGGIARTPAATIAGGAAVAYAGTHWLVAGQGGLAQRVGLDGAPPRPFFAAPAGATVNAAAWRGDEWRLAVGSTTVSVDRGGTPGTPALAFYKKETVKGLAWAGGRWLATEGGSTALLDAAGARIGLGVKSGTWPEDVVAGGPGAFLVCGSSLASVVEPQGAVFAAPAAALYPSVCRAASAGAEGWLIAGDQGLARRLSAEGAAIGTSSDVLLGQTVHALAWNGKRWLAGGAGGLVRVVGPDGLGVGKSKVALDGATVRAIAWDGEAWLVGGVGGLVQTVSADGVPLGLPTDVLAGATILTLSAAGPTLDPGDSCANDGDCPTATCAGGRCACAAGCAIDGACVAAMAASPGSPCLRCDPDMDAFGWSPAPDRAPCADDSPCGGPLVCRAGACDGAAACDDGDPCTTDVCDAQAGACVVVPATGPCDDGDPCTEDEVCAAGACVGASASCDDGDPCTADSCAPGAGCVHAPAAGPCDDGNPCTGAGSCVAGSCTLGPAAADGTPCGVPAVCEAVGACVAGVCLSSGPVSGCAPVLVGGDRGAVQVTDAALPGLPGATRTLMPDKTVVSLCPTPQHTLAVASQTAFRRVFDDLTPQSHTVALTGSTLYAAARGPTGCLIASSGNQVISVDDGGTIGTGSTYILGSASPRAIAWSGTEYLVGGTKGAYTRVSPVDIQPLTGGTALGGGEILAIAWGGTEWLVGGADGRVQRVGAAGALAGPVVTVLQGQPVRTIVRVDGGYLVAGGGGLIQRLSASGEPVPGTLEQIGGGWNAAAASPGGVMFVGDGGQAVFLSKDGVAGPAVTALEGATARAVVWRGDRFIVGGDEGRLQVLTSADVSDSPHQTANGGLRIAAAAWDGASFLVAGAAHHQLLDATGAATSPWSFASPTLGGGEVFAAAAGDSGWLACGADGRRAVISAAGGAGPVWAAAGGSLLAASWNGANWLVGGADGTVQLVDATGAAVGAAQTALGGETIRAVSWSGQYWLVAGGGGRSQLVSPAGEPVGSPQVALVHNTIRAAAWSGEAWLVAGDFGFAQLLGPDGVATSLAADVLDGRSVSAAAWTGAGWTIGGGGGRIRHLSPDATPSGWTRVALGGETVRTLAVGGEAVAACTDDAGCDGAPCVNGACVTAPPLPPDGLEAQSLPGGLVGLQWAPPAAGPAPVGYAVYRSAAPIVAVAGLTPVALTVDLDLLDAPPADGTWFYGVTAWIDPGTQSAPSVVAGVADGTAPVATIIAGGVKALGPGTHRVALLASEPLVTAPSLTLKVGGQAIAVTLALDGKSGLLYRGELHIDATTPSGHAVFAWSGQDPAGNVGAAIASGQSASIDTTPPSATITAASPASAGAVPVSLAASEPLAFTPTLRCELPGGAVVAVLLGGKGAAWSGVLSIPAGTASGTATFTFGGKDAAGNVGTGITRGAALKIDTQPPGAPLGVTATVVTGTFVRVAWSAPQGETLSGFRVYRAAAPIASVVGLTPIAALTGRRITDQAPSPGTWHYAVTAVDLAGNEGAPASAAPVVIGAPPQAPLAAPSAGPAPPATLRATVEQGEVALEWQTSPDAVTYRVLRDGAPLTETDALEADGGLTPDEPARVLYEVAAVDAAGQQGAARAVTVYPLTLTVTEAGWPAPGGWELTRGFFDRVEVQVQSDDADDVAVGPLTLRLLDGGTLWEGPAQGGATIPSGELVQLEAGAFTPLSAPDVLAVGARLVIPGDAGSETVLLSETLVGVRWAPDPGVDAQATGLLPGALGVVRVAVTNHGSAPMDIVTAQGGPSPDVSVTLLDGDAPLATAALEQTAAPAQAFPAGHFVRVAPAATWLSGPIPLLVPPTAPPVLTLAVQVGKAWHLLPDPLAIVGPELGALLSAPLTP